MLTLRSVRPRELRDTNYAKWMVALYGKSYIKAAKDTWRLIKDRGK